MTMSESVHDWLALAMVFIAAVWFVFVPFALFSLLAMADETTMRIQGIEDALWEDDDEEEQAS